jgi:hypothetical protein
VSFAWDAHGLYVAPDLAGGLALHDAHENEEGNRVHDGAHGHAVNEPLRQRVAQTEGRLSNGRGRGGRVTRGSVRCLLHGLELDVALLELRGL